jgi:shikimate kinase
MSQFPPSQSPVPNAVLIGLRGSGKSSVGAVLAELRICPFIDLDDVTCSLLDAPTVAEAWQLRGVAAFRLAETAALRSVLRTGGQVISLGGGTPTAPGAADLLRVAARDRTAVIIYLRAPAEVLRDRLAASDPALRPPLIGTDPLAEIDIVLARRDPLYLSLADHIIETRALTPDQIARKVAELL